MWSSFDSRGSSLDAIEGADVASVSVVRWEKTESVMVCREGLLKLLKRTAGKPGEVGETAAELEALLTTRTSSGASKGISKREAPTGETSRTALLILGLARGCGYR